MFAFGRSASDWLSRRLLKIFLKRNLANLLANEVDVEQLSVQLDKGSVELRDCLLDVDYLNERLVSDLHSVPRFGIPIKSSHLPHCRLP